jgi:hypothetical protein
MVDLEEERNTTMDQGKTSKTPTPITFRDDGEPQTPSVTQVSGSSAKVLQAALRNYCLAHIRESHMSGICPFIHICILGFISGDKKAIIKWADIIKDPTSWIDEECYPPGFQWANPSKICMKPAIHLLNHWRQQRDSGHSPIIWNPLCEALTAVDQPALRVQCQSWSDANEDNDGDEDFAAKLARIFEDRSDLEDTIPEAQTVQSSPSAPRLSCKPLSFSWCNSTLRHISHSFVTS